MRNEVRDADALLLRKVKVDVRRAVLFEFGEDLEVGRAEDLVYSVNLVELIRAGEERIQARDFKEDAPGAPQVHLGAVVTVREQALGRAIPARRNVFGVRL